MLDRRSTIPLSRQIYKQLSRAIRDGHFGADNRLPSTRAMAGLLGLSRNTVLAAYDELTADGLISAARGSGTSVESRAHKRVPIQFTVEDVLREAGFPARVLQLEDQDGNGLYVRY